MQNLYRLIRIEDMDINRGKVKLHDVVQGDREVFGLGDLQDPFSAVVIKNLPLYLSPLHRRGSLWQNLPQAPGLAFFRKVV